jgi:hypothetical protein
MATFTTRLGLRKPNNTTDLVNVVTDLDDNFDDIDAAIGWLICTSTTRPGSPWQGQPIYETDTKTYRVWNGTRWAIINREVTVFNPTVTGGPSGYTNVGQYQIVGDYCHYEGQIVFGSTNGSPGGDYTFNAPVAADTSINNPNQGQAWFRDISPGADYASGFCFFASPTIMQMRGLIGTYNGSGVFGQGTPVTIVSGDWVSWSMRYRIASSV